MDNGPSFGGDDGNNLLMMLRTRFRLGIAERIPAARLDMKLDPHSLNLEAMPLKLGRGRLGHLNDLNDDDTALLNLDHADFISPAKSGSLMLGRFGHLNDLKAERTHALNCSHLLRMPPTISGTLIEGKLGHLKEGM